MKTKLFLITLFTLMLSSKSLAQKPLKTTLDATKNEGLIIGTISFEDAKSIISDEKVFSVQKTDVLFHDTRKAVDSLRRIGQLRDFFDSFIISKKSENFIEDGKLFYFFTCSKLSGKYRISDLQVIRAGRKLQPVKLIKLNIPFEIQAGQINYLGQIKYNVKNGTVDVIDNYERDKIQFNQKFPHMQF